MLLAGLSVYDKFATEAVCQSKADCIIVGDMFCSKRMGGSIYELMEHMACISKSGKQVCFQTPMYVTDRVFDDVLDQIRCLYERNVISSVILQDIGLLRQVKNRFPELHVFWNCMSIGRSGVSNVMYYKLLSENGVSIFITGNIVLADGLSAAGYSVIALYGVLRYNTMNRECYYCHENNIYDKNCGRGCLKKEQTMTQDQLDLNLTVDGHLLGRRLEYSDLKSTRLFLKKAAGVSVYADSAEELNMRIGELIGE